jgi:hypothetical protein
MMSEFNYPFTRQQLGEEPKLDTFTVRLNAEERLELNEAKKILRQTKDSTAMKQLAKIGMYVLHDNLMGGISRLIMDNVRRNERTGVLEDEGQRRAKVPQNQGNGDTIAP